MNVFAMTGAHGALAPLREPGLLVCYAGDSGAWRPAGRLPLDLGAFPNIRGFRLYLEERLAEWGPAGEFLAARIPGAPGAVLSALGFRLWESDQEPLGVLDRIAAEPRPAARGAASACSGGGGDCGAPGAAETADADADPAARVLAGLRPGAEPGSLYLDVAAGQRLGHLPTKPLLLPLLRRGGFASLEIDIDKVPCWFESDLPELGYRHEAAGGESPCRVRILPR